MKILITIILSILFVFSGASAAEAGPIAGAALLAAGSGGIPLGGFAFASAASSFTALSAVGGLVSTVMGARQQQQAIEYQTAVRRNDAIRNADIANRNAARAADNATQARLAANIQKERVDRDTRLRLSTMKNKFARGGVTVGTGSSLLAALEQARQGALEKQDIDFSASLQASGFDSEEQIRLSEAERLRQTANEITVAGDIESGAAGISSASNIFGGIKTVFNATSPTATPLTSF